MFFDAQFAGAGVEAFGGFCLPNVVYPGQSTDLKFANGTAYSFDNLAYVVGVDSWKRIASGADFYQVFVQASSYGASKSERSQIAPAPIIKREVPEGFPEPFSTPDFEDDSLFFSGYFLPYGGSTSGLAVLSSPSFFASDKDTARFQGFIKQFLDACRSRGTQKIIIDMSSNGGGTAVLSFDMFKQVSRACTE